MSEFDDEVRALLQHKAEDVPPQRRVPAKLVGRVRGRMALNAVVMGATAAVLVAGAITVVRVLGPSENLHPASTPPPSSSSSSAPPACTSGQLRAVGSMQGAAGSREGQITLTNFSNKTCTLKGTPTLQLLDQNMHPIKSGIRFSNSPAGWQANAQP